MKTMPTDADHIRRTYQTVLGGPPYRGSDEQRAHLAGVLRGQLQRLLEDLEGCKAAMPGETSRATADHLVSRSREALAADEASSRQPDGLYDLAVLTRSCLILCELAAAAAIP